MGQRRPAKQEYLDHPDWPAELDLSARVELRAYWCFAVRAGSGPHPSSCYPGCAGALSAVTLIVLLLTGLPPLSRLPATPLDTLKVLLLVLSSGYLAYLLLRLGIYRLWARLKLRRILELHRKVAALPWTVQCLIHLDKLPPARLADYELELISDRYSDPDIEWLVDYFDMFERALPEPFGRDESLFENSAFKQHCESNSLDYHELARHCSDFPLRHLIDSVLAGETWPSTLNIVEWEKLLLKLRL